MDLQKTETLSWFCLKCAEKFSFYSSEKFREWLMPLCGSRFGESVWLPCIIVGTVVRNCGGISTSIGFTGAKGVHRHSEQDLWTSWSCGVMSGQFCIDLSSCCQGSLQFCPFVQVSRKWDEFLDGFDMGTSRRKIHREIDKAQLTMFLIYESRASLLPSFLLSFFLSLSLLFFLSIQHLFDWLEPFNVFDNLMAVF